jgi:protein-tyrosine-phosphatase
MPSRRDFLLGTIAAGLCARAIAAPDSPPQILFVCQFGSVKSAIARELFKRRANERAIAVKVQSRGITPEAHLPADLQDVLAKDGIDPARDPLRKLEADDLRNADRVVIFDPLPAGLSAKAVDDWSDLPSMVKDYAHARAILDKRIDQLLDELAKSRANLP